MSATPDPATWWHGYYAADVAARAASIIEACAIPSTGVTLHADLYRRAEPDAPVLVLNHGGGGHAGLFVALALAFFDRGYSVLVPDQRGQGRSGGAMGDFTVDEAVQNIVDAADWARARFTGPLYLAGGSIGGGLTYFAAAALAALGRPPRAVQCLDLYDFGDPRTGLGFTRFAALAKIPGMAMLSRAFFRALGAVAPSLRLPYRPLARFRDMVDARDQAAGFHAHWAADPCVLRTVTARYMASVLGTPARIPFEANTDVPVQVVNQRRDRMVDPALTRAAYERLGGPKSYHAIDWGHFSLQPAFTEELVALGDGWFRRYR